MIPARMMTVSTISISETARMKTADACSGWTVADLAERFGPMPLSRIRMEPPAGQAKEADVLSLHDQCDRLFELADGTLVEKDMGAWESGIAALIVHLLNVHVREHDAGLVLGSDGMYQLCPGLVRIPDVSFVSWSRLPRRTYPTEPIAVVVPDLAVEVLSPGNTQKEMSRKLDDYLTAGVRLVWYIDLRARVATVYRGTADGVVLSAEQSLSGDEVLPGLAIPLAELFKHAPES